MTEDRSKLPSLVRILNYVIACLGLILIFLLGGFYFLPESSGLIIASAWLVSVLLVLVFIYRISAGLRGRIIEAHDNSFRQNEALQYVNGLLGDHKVLNSRHWSMSPDLLAEICRLVMLIKPGSIVELGCGNSTFVLSSLIEKQQLSASVTCIEQSEEIARSTGNQLSVLFPSVQVKTIYSKIKSIEGIGVWYDVDTSEIPAIDLLLIDGPSSAETASRYPAIPVLLDKMNPGCMIILDDYGRDMDKEIVGRWLKEYPTLQLEREIPTEKGAVILRKDR